MQSDVGINNNSEEFHKTILDNIINGVWVSDKDDLIFYINKGMEIIAGVPAEKMLGAMVLKDFLENTLKYFRSYYLKAKGTLTRVYYDAIPVETPAGRQSYQSGWLIPRIKDGMYDGMVCTVEDVTERKNLEEALKKKEKILEAEKNKLEQIMNSTVDGISTLDITGNVIQSNRAFAELIGYESEKQIIGKNMAEFTRKEDVPKVISAMKEGIKEGIIRNLDVVGVTKQGKNYYASINAKLLKDENGKLNWIGVVRDVSEKNKLEQKLEEMNKNLEQKVKERTEELKESEEKYRLISENVNDLISVMDKNMKYEYINEETTKRILGYSNEDMLGKKAIKFLHPDDLEQVIKKFKKGWNTGKGSVEVRFRRKSGEYIWLSIRGKTFIGTDGKTKGLFTARNITERKKTEQKLKESEKRFSTAFYMNSNLCAISNVEDGKYVEVNDMFLEIIQTTREEIIGKSASNLYQDPKDRDFLIAELKEKGKVTNYELNFKNMSGDPLVGLFSFDVVEMDGKPYLISIAQNITERKKAEKRLIESEEKFKMIFMESPIAITLYDSNAKLLNANKACLDLINVPDVETIKGFDLFNDPNLPGDAREKLLNGEPVKFEIKYDFEKVKDNLKAYKSGTMFFDAIITPIHQADGNISNYLNQVQDITERKKAEERIADLARFPSEDPYPVLRVNQEEILYINQAGINLFNVEEGDKTPELFKRIIDETFTTNLTKQIELELHYKIFSFTIAPIQEKEYANIYGMEITSIKEAEKKLVELDKIKSELLRRTSHELKTPLVSIKGFSDILLELHKDKLDDYILTTIQEIKQGCIRLETLIGDILKTAELESGRTELKRSEEDLSFLIKFCVNELKGFSKLRNHTITLDINEKLTAYCEKEQIHQVVSNLLSNAIKYTLPNGQIHIQSRNEDDLIIVSVKDNGIGFTEEEKDKIFQQFGKIERYGQGFDIISEGTGLGLYICKKIIEMHGGKIWVDSPGRNKGSTFSFSLPIIKD